MLFPLVHEAGVEPEPHVVQEDPVARAADVDHPLGSVGEGFESGDRVVWIETEIAGEVVPRPAGNADERKAAFEGCRGYFAEAAVAPRSAQRVSIGGPRELPNVVPPLEDMYLDPALPRFFGDLGRGHRSLP
jgi:hypothetical protein